MSSSLHLTFVFFLPSLILSLLFLFSSPMSRLFPPLSYPLFLLPATLISLLCPLSPFPLLCLLSPLSQILLLELKGSTLAQAWGLLGARGGHCVPRFILGVPQLSAAHLGSTLNFPSSQIGTAALCSKKSKGEGYSANGLFCLCRNQHSPQRNVFTSMTHKAWTSWRRGAPGTAIKPSRWVWWRSTFPWKELSSASPLSPTTALTEGWMGAQGKLSPGLSHKQAACFCFVQENTGYQPTANVGRQLSETWVQ